MKRDDYRIRLADNFSILLGNRLEKGSINSMKFKNVFTKLILYADYSVIMPIDSLG